MDGLSKNLDKKREISLILGLWLIAGLVSSVLADRTVVRIETNFGDMVISLLTDDAPETVENFLDYVESDFFDGLIFHRVVNDPNPFVIQAGAYDPNLYLANDDTDPNYFLNPNWTKDPNFFHVPNEPVDSEADNGFSNIRGTVAMALSGGDADSGTSQFFINLTDNSFLDAQDFTVFGEVIVGMELNGVVDTIGSVATQSIGDSGPFSMEDVPDANTPVIIEDVVVEQVFESDSGTFTNVDYLRAADGELRTYVGQGNFSGKRYTHSFSDQELLGVDSLRWVQTAVAGFGVAVFDLSLAKDEDDVIWVLDYEIDGEAVIDANSLADAVMLNELGQEDMLFKLMAGEFNDALLSDPINTIMYDDEGETRTDKIVGLNESLDVFPNFDDELAQVRSAIEPDPVIADWRWNHESLGLVLEVVNSSPDQGAVDPNGHGWRFLIPDLLGDPNISFKSGKSRTTPSDSFKLTGAFDVDQETVANNTLYFFIGPFEEAIEGSDFKRSNNDRVFTFNGVSNGGGKLFMQINFKKSSFELRADKVNLTGLEEPVYVEMVMGNFFIAGQAPIRKGKPLPMAFRQGVSNSLRVDHFRYVSDNKTGFSTSRSLKIKGAIATGVNPDDPNGLIGQEISVIWGTKTMTVPAGAPNTPALVRKGQGQKYVYRSKTGSIRRAMIDLDRNKFEFDVRSSGLGEPTGNGQDFRVQFDVTNDDPFDETVEGVAVNSLWKLSGD